MSVLAWDANLTFLPIIHGSGSFAVQVRQFLLENRCDCLAIPLPPSFRDEVIAGTKELPAVSAVVSMAVNGDADSQENAGEEDAREIGSDIPNGNAVRQATYVPVEPCQAVIAAIRFAIQERIPVEFIDSDEIPFTADEYYTADPFALTMTTLERFCAAALPVIGRPKSIDRKRRIQWMAGRLNELRSKYRHIAAMCSINDWPWIREALSQASTLSDDDSESSFFDATAKLEPIRYGVDSRTLLFALGELPYITGLYERARVQFDDDTGLALDGLKELFLAARSSYQLDLGSRARTITPLLVAQCLKYIRNQTLLDRRLTPCFYTIAKSAQQMMGDQFAIHLVSASRDYPHDPPPQLTQLRMGIDQAQLPEFGLTKMVNRLPGPPMTWVSLELNKPALKLDKRKWSMGWNPYKQCSWPEEDVKIESFRNRVLDRAKGLLGADLARSEKFTTSMMDGLDLRETLRHWYSGSLYVKVLPPTIGQLDATVMLFDNEPDPREYSWRATWFAEHEEESTLAFFATPFQKEMLGPGIAVSSYGGAMFLYPPRHIEDIWDDPRLDFTDTMEQRMVAAACMHAQSRHIALLSYSAPGIALKRIAKMYKRKLVHVPLGHFADSVVKQLRIFHVLNGTKVRSYAAHFIRKA